MKQLHHTWKFIFKNLPSDTCGMCDFESKIIYVDLNKRDDCAQTLYHEVLHALHPDWTEKRVLQAERNGWARLSQADKFAFLQKTFTRAKLGVKRGVVKKRSSKSKK
jgi:hypothetical protein